MTDLLTPRIIAAADAIHQARADLKRVMDAARIVAVDMAADGWTEVAIAKALGVNRLTVRRWLGK